MTNQATNIDASKDIDLTNNSNTDVVILMPSTADSPDSANSVNVYDQNLEILSSLKGNKVIKQGNSATFVLDQQYKDPKTGKMVDSLVYNLLVSSSDWYYPVDNIGVMQNIFADPPSYDSQTVIADEQKSMNDAAVFYQTISAYPTSQLTKNYQAAMSGTQTKAQSQADGSADSSDNVANSITNNVNDFFQTTKGFQDVTLASLVAVENYYNKFPFVWAQYKSTTYYLYSSDGSTTSFVGTLALKQPTTIDLTKANGGYINTFTPASNPSDTTTVKVDSSNAKLLTYSDALFVDNVNLDIPSIAVKGTFQLKRLFTQKTTDTSIIPVITGTIDGATCIGFDSPQLSNDKSSSAYWNTLFHPKNSQEVFQSIMTIGGALMMLQFTASTLYGVFRWARNLGKVKEPTTADLFKQQQESFEKILNEKIDAAVKKVSDGKQSAPENPDDAMDSISSERSTVTDNLNSANLQDGLKAESGTLEELAQYESEMNSTQLQSLEENATSIKTSDDALKNATTDSLHDAVSEQQTNFTDIQSNVGDLTDQLDSSLSQQSKTEIDGNKTVSEEAAKDVENSQKDQEEDASNEDPDAEEPIEPFE